MLKAITTKYHCPVICISSIGRNFYKKKITREAFKESGMIEYTANLQLALNFPDDVFVKTEDGAVADSVDPKKLEEWKAERVRNIEISILKNRDGVDGGNLTVDLAKARLNHFEISIDGKCCELKQTKIIPKNTSANKSEERPPRPSNTKIDDDVF